MTAPNILNYSNGESQPWRRGAGGMVLIVLNVLAGVLGILMIFAGASSIADGWGGLFVMMLDFGLAGVQLLLLLGTVIYAIVQARRHPIRAGRALTGLIVTSVVASTLVGAVIAVFCLVPHKGAC